MTTPESDRVMEALLTAIHELRDEIRALRGSSQTIGGWPSDRPFPALLTDAQLHEVFDISERTFRDWKRRGRFKALEAPAGVVPGIVRYSGAKVKQYVDGEWTFARIVRSGTQMTGSLAPLNAGDTNLVATTAASEAQ